jgi:hypothetical protein
VGPVQFTVNPEPDLADSLTPPDVVSSNTKTTGGLLNVVANETAFTFPTQALTSAKLARAG